MVTGLLTIKLDASDAVQQGTVAVANIHEDVNSGNIGRHVAGRSTVSEINNLQDDADAVCIGKFMRNPD